MADEEFVIVHGRFSGFGQPVNWIAADILRIKDGILAEHWDVIQDEATRESSKSGLPMFGDNFPKGARIPPCHDIVIFGKSAGRSPRSPGIAESNTSLSPVGLCTKIRASPHLSFPRKRESSARGTHHPTWIPAFAGMTGLRRFRFPPHRLFCAKPLPGEGWGEVMRYSANL